MFPFFCYEVSQESFKFFNENSIDFCALQWPWARALPYAKNHIRK
jgi:hypothetical protein